MADMKKIATRVSYGNTLVELARQGADNLVVFDADLAAATKTEIFRKEFPDRHFDCAEQNMVGVAAGMSTMGYVPFVSSFAMFVAGRGFEQIRNSIGYPHRVYRKRQHGRRPLSAKSIKEMLCQHRAEPVIRVVGEPHRVGRALAHQTDDAHVHPGAETVDAR